MRVGIALGSNLGDRLENLRQGVVEIQQLPHLHEPPLTSRIYETEPVDTDAGAGAFLNAVIEIDATCDSTTLLRSLQGIERDLGRPAEHARNASRTLDLDILYAGDEISAKHGLTIPHPRLQLRRFVLQPLSDIRPDLILPGQSASIAQLLNALADRSPVRAISAKLLPSHAELSDS